MPAPNTPWEEMVTDAMHDCTDVFGEGSDNVTYTHVNGTPYTLDGIWSAESVEVDPDTGVQIISNEPMISFAMADMQGMADNGDTVEVRGKTYKVKEPYYDGHGTVTVHLWRV